MTSIAAVEGTRMLRSRIRVVARVLMLLGLLAGRYASAQPFNSGSTGADGALDLTGTAPGTIVFDPRTFNPPLDPEGDNVYHFTTINIPTGVTLRLSASILGVAPVVWLASGAVQIDGTIDLAGQKGHDYNQTVVPSVAGAGGFGGGKGATTTTAWELGNGFGGGRNGSGGAGHTVAGGSGSARGGLAYGNDFLLPMLGGSGGAGSGCGAINGGGGAGGGAIIVASSTSITVSGGIAADGGAGGCNNANYDCQGGAGSGGAIRLMSPLVSGAGSLTARGTIGCNSSSGGGYPANQRYSSHGRIRIETFQQLFTGTIDPAPTVVAPGVVFSPPTGPGVRITSIGGLNVPANATGSYVVPDVSLTNASAVPIAMEGRNIPLGTVVHLTLRPETGSAVTVDSSPLAGTVALSTATATVTIPHGFSRFLVTANWTP